MSARTARTASGTASTGTAILLLAEAGGAHAREHGLRVVAELAVAGEFDREPVDRRNQRRHQPAEPERGGEDLVVHPVVEPLAEARTPA